MHSGSEIWPVYVISQKEDFYQNILCKIYSGN